MPEGRIDEETTANLGIIDGGMIRNGVPEKVTIKGECRSLNHDKALAQADAMRQAFESAAQEAGAQADVNIHVAYEASQMDPSVDVVQKALAAVRAAGIDPVAKVITGGTDALVLANRGMEAVVLGFGGGNAHSTDEYIPVADLEKCAEILRHLIEAHA